jgi:hypothetical protein
MKSSVLIYDNSNIAPIVKKSGINFGSNGNFFGKTKKCG